MAAPQRWWVVGNQITRTGHFQWEIVSAATRPANWEFVYGPFGTRAQAEARLDKASSPIKPPDIDPHIPNPLSGLSALGKVAHWFGDIVLHLTDIAMWRSLGWMLLGAVLIFAGIYLWFRTSATYDELQSAVLGGVKAAV